MADPFFIVGFQRSGTTLLRVMLDNHPSLAIPLDPVGLWSRYAERLGDYNDLETADDIEAIVQDISAEERIRLWSLSATPREIAAAVGQRRWPAVISSFYEAYARQHGKAQWGDKDPGNMTRLHLLNEWFPEARFVHIVRDGRDACLSHLKQDFGFSAILPCAAAWREQVWWVRSIGRILGPERYHELRYEDLITRPEEQLSGVCCFLQVDFVPEMLHYHERVSRSIPESKRHIWPLIEKPPQASNAGGWKRALSPSLRICFEKRAATLLRELGYETLVAQPSGAWFEETRQIVKAALNAVRARRNSRAAAGSGTVRHPESTV